MEISTGYHFTAVREEIRKTGTESQSGIGPRGKGPIRRSSGRVKCRGHEEKGLEGRLQEKVKYK